MNLDTPHIRLLQHACSRRSYWNVKPVGRAFWRLYWNRSEGARIIHDGRSVDLTPDTVVLITPQTPFIARYFTSFEHYFVHFQLGYPYDWLSNRVFTSCVTEALRRRLDSLATMASRDAERSLQHQWQLISVLSWVLAEIPADAWPKLPPDSRVLATVEYIEANTTLLTNADMAERVNMSCNGFIRLFRQHMGLSPQRYVMQRRLAKACRLLTCSDETIESIADACGFCDRNYFSAVFKRHHQMGPAMYRSSSRGELS